MLRRLIILLAAILGAGLAVVAPANAANGWQTYNMTTPDPVWDCAKPWEIQSGLFMRACVIHSSLSKAQAAVIVSNYTGVTKTIRAPEVSLWWDRGYWERLNLRACGEHPLLNRTSRACLAPTLGPYCRWMGAVGEVHVDGWEYRNWYYGVRVCEG